MTRQKIYDAIVVGAGANGSWAAKELTERGMQVLMLEAGGWTKDQNSSEVMEKQLHHFLKRQPIQSTCYAWKYNNPSFFVDDIDNPYTTLDDNPFIWFRSRQVGGRMVVKGHGRQMYRFSDYQFKAASHDGYGEVWPITYAELAPYYDRVERWIGIRGAVENIPYLPDSIFLPNLQATCGEQLLKSALECYKDHKDYKDHNYRVITGRTTSLKLPLATAMKTQRLELRSNAIVSHILVDTNTGKAKGVAFIDQHTHNSYEVLGNIIVLCASTIESTRILLNSATRQHPEGLANSSGLLGHYLMDHIKIGIRGIIPDPKRFLGSLSKESDLCSSLYIPQFKNIDDRHPNYIRGYGIQALVEWRAQSEEDLGFEMTAFGEMLPQFESCVTLNQDKQDAWGIPVAHIASTYSDNEYEMARDQMRSLKAIAQSAGLEILHEDTKISLPGMSIHEVGTARMGADPQKSVLNAFNQSWDVKNLFVMDGSCFVSQGCQNPTLTMMALTARACDYILNQYKRDHL